jgi:hypothetical protein
LSPATSRIALRFGFESEGDGELQLKLVADLNNPAHI